MNDLFKRKFLPYVKKTDTCWLWTGEKLRLGYGRQRIGGHWKHPTRIMAHRLSWELFVGPIPSDMNVLHRCDNRLCVNPDHLFLGTNDDNVADRVRKGRSAKLLGEKHPRAKLTWDQVKEIRSIYKPKYGALIALARKYGVCSSNIGWIIRGDHWKEQPFEGGIRQ